MAAAFFNFHPDMVARAVPGCWDVVAPGELTVRRAIAAAAALGDLCDAESLGTLADALPLLRRTVGRCETDGRILAGANQALSTSLVSELGLGHLSPAALRTVEAWQACTTLREHRGDGHVAALLSHGISGLEAHILVSATEGIPAETLRDNRGWSEVTWSDGMAALVRRGWLSDDGRATSLGHEVRQSVESVTERLAEQPLEVLTDSEVAALHSALVACARQIQDSDLYPFPNPMGLPPLA